MLPTPTTSHLTFTSLYEPSEDTFHLLDALSSDSSFLHARFPQDASPPPLVLELGSGSGVVTSFLTAHAHALFGRFVATLATDVAAHAVVATVETVAVNGGGGGLLLDALNADLAAPVRGGVVDVLVFNPPYVPSDSLPEREGGDWLEIACAGGRDGMEVTERALDGLAEVLSDRGVAYVLMCKRNRPEEVVRRLREGEYAGGVRWVVQKVGSDGGKKAGWEVLGVWRIARPV